MFLFLTAVSMIIGSFLNVCIYRIPRKESIAFPASHCGSCNTSLKPVDLVPVFSYLFLRGRCRYCGTKISLQYPLIEILNGVLWLLVYLQTGYSIMMWFYCGLGSLLLVISAIDYETMEIPDELSIFGAAFGILFSLFMFKQNGWLSPFLGFFIGGGSFLLIAMATNGAMGGGDIKLAAFLGIWLGWDKTLLFFLLSFLIGALISVFLIMLKLKGRKDYIPFGPFMSVGAFIALLYGDALINWYLNLLI